jgi:predicted alpha/beta-hydrolase family hydrolase
MTPTGITGLLLTPGAGAGRNQSALVAVDEAVTGRGITVERIEFPGRAAGRRRPDTPEVCIESVRTATSGLARRLNVRTSVIAVGGRSMGGRMCSMAAAQGLVVGALVLISYPLHPARTAEQLRSGHFSDLHVPCLFVSGRRDALGTPDEIRRETAAIPGPVTLVFLDGDHSLRRRDTEIAAIVADWLTDTRERSDTRG